MFIDSIRLKLHALLPHSFLIYLKYNRYILKCKSLTFLSAFYLFNHVIITTITMYLKGVF